MEHFKVAGDVFQIDVGYAKSVAETVKEIESMPAVDTPETLAKIEEADAEFSAI